MGAVFPLATAQACVIHLIRATLRYASRKYWDALAKDLRAIYTAPSADAAWAAFEDLEDKWGAQYPAIPRLWRAAWEEFIPFLDYGGCLRMPAAVAADGERSGGVTATAEPERPRPCLRGG